MRYYFLDTVNSMEKRRRKERFTIELPVKLEIAAMQEKLSFNLVTKNISANGAYLNMVNPIPEDTKVRLTILLINDTVKESTGFQGLLKVEGKVVRCEQTGIAIRFAKKYQLERMMVSSAARSY